MLPDACEGLVQHLLILAVARDEIGARFGELVDLAEQDIIRDHEMHMEGPLGQAAQPSDEIRKQQERGGEMAVRHVDMIDIGMRLGAADVVLEAGEVRRP